MDDLTTLPGVARKTANVVLSVAFGKNEGIAVDTHVKRLSSRLGLTMNTDPIKLKRRIKSFEKSEIFTLLDITKKKFVQPRNRCAEHLKDSVKCIHFRI
jgi:endonuclease-3